MEETLTVQTLIRRFEEKLRRLEEDAQSRPAGNGPRFPLLTVCIGQNAAENRRQLAENLRRLWPRHRRELRFLCAEASDGETDCPGLNGGGTMQEKASSADNLHVTDDDNLHITDEDGASIGTEGLRRTVTELFGAGTHFQEYNRLFLLTVLDTGGFRSAPELLSALNAARSLRRETGVEDAGELWVLLLDEGHGKQDLGRDIRRELAGVLDGGTVPDGTRPSAHPSKSISPNGTTTLGNLSTRNASPLPPVLLLSNRRSDGRIDGNWSDCLRIAADVCAVWDSGQEADFHRDSVLTAGYCREEKPRDDISQFLICQLLDSLSEPETPLSAEELRERLDIAPDGTFRFLDLSGLARTLPEPFQLTLFPVPSPQGAERLSPGLTAGEFNERTFGAWDCWLRLAMERFRADGGDAAQEAERYADLLRERFSSRELSNLRARRVDVETWFREAKPPSGELPVLAYGERYWTYLASSDPALISALLDTLDRLAQEAASALEAWEELCRSRAALHDIRDADLTAFYRGLYRNWFDASGAELRKAFRTVRNRADLSAFLDGAMDSLLRDGAVRRTAGASFGDELEYRLNSGAEAEDANRQILRRLTGDGVPVYLLANFNLGSPVRSCVLMGEDRNASLYRDLRANLGPETVFFDTRDGTAVEALNLYRVAREQLL